MKFQRKLEEAMKKNHSLLCVGLDTDSKKIPTALRFLEFPLFEFNKHIIDATHDLVCAYKPNSAFYEAHGEQGIHELKLTCDYIRRYYPFIPIILDAKRADIENTNKGYITFSFDFLKVDAITLHPYLGRKALGPFLERSDKGCIILCKTSNTGSGEFQDKIVDGMPLYEFVARQVVKWNRRGNCMLVAGATYPDELGRIRELVGEMTLLVPGVGTQGGELRRIMKKGLNSKKQGMIINVSRAVLYASSDKDFAEKARREAHTLKKKINHYRRS